MYISHITNNNAHDINGPTYGIISKSHVIIANHSLFGISTPHQDIIARASHIAKVINKLKANLAFNRIASFLYIFCNLIYVVL